MQFLKTFGGQNRFDPKSYFSVALYDLKEMGEVYSGILAPEPERNLSKVGISAQFLENAALYHERYSNTEHYMNLFSEAIAATHYHRHGAMDILDIGTGSGANSVIPCARLFPGSRIIATDLSPQLLAILKRYISSTKIDSRVSCVCTDAMNDFFKPSKFDLVTGSAILHHLLDPSLALRSAHRALRRGGTAMFFEPFEAGFMVLCSAFQNILLLNDHRRDLSPQVEKVLKDMILDWTTRSGSDKSAEINKYLDDKWLFTRKYLYDRAKAIGFKSIDIVPHYYGDSQFRAHTNIILKLHSGLPPDAMTQWAWNLISLDKAFSKEAKHAYPRNQSQAVPPAVEKYQRQAD